MFDKKEITATLAKMLEIPSNELRNDMLLTEVPRWDSLKHMNLIVALEKEYSVTFSFEEISQMTDVKSIEKLLAEKGG